MSESVVYPKKFTFLCGAHMDQIMRLKAPSVYGASNPAKVETYPGGAALNTASISAALGIDCTLVSPIGSDAGGNHLVSVCHERGIRSELVPDKSYPTGIYSAVFEPDGNLLIGASDLSIYDVIDDGWLNAHLEKCDGLYFTSNLEEAHLPLAIGKSDFIAAATISPAKAARLTPILGEIDVLFTNAKEAQVLTRHEDRTKQAEWLMHKGVVAGTISDGAKDLVYWHNEQITTTPIRSVETIADVNGAGDALAGGILAGLALYQDFDKAINLGLEAAAYSISHNGPFNIAMTMDSLDKKS